MDKLSSEIKRTEEQIFNLENVLDTTNIQVKQPEKEFLEELYKNLQIFNKDDRNKFISEAAKNNNINPDNKTFHTFKNDQRTALASRLKEKLEYLQDKVKNEESNKESEAKEA